VGLLFAQFFGAMNDNVLKGVLTFMVIDGPWQDRLGSGSQGIVGLCFTIPFLLLSGFAGQVADRYSKRMVTYWVKVAEIPIVLVAGLGFYFGNLWVTLGALTVMAVQSAFFGPAKYGMIKELVGEAELSRANGTINMLTNIAVILGTVVSGLTSDRYSPQDTAIAGSLWLPCIVMTGLAVLGLVTALLLEGLPPGDRNLRYNWNPLEVYITTMREMAKSRLLMVMMAWGYFFLLAGIALLVVPEYTKVLNINRTDASILLGVMGIAIGLGCAAAGWISGHRIEPRLIPFGAFGLILFFFLLGVIPPSLADAPGPMAVALSNVSLLILGAGFASGFYIVPLQSLLQKLSPDDGRGRFLGTANAVSFAFFALASIVFWVIRESFDAHPQQIFLLSSAMMAVGAAYFLWKLRGTGILVGSTSTSTETR
jgi:acyl-[acyl-carrier-protein]-phospholipid O-acyltransferase/long-chain-fatty-acid--[acyl-carrier-protein] ligase